MRCPSLVKDQGKHRGLKSYFETVFPKMSSDYALSSAGPRIRGVKVGSAAFYLRLVWRLATGWARKGVLSCLMLAPRVAAPGRLC